MRFASLLAVLALVLLAAFGRGTLASYARQSAVGHLKAGAVTPAQDWLAWSAWFDPLDGRTDLVAAACYRRLQEVERFAEKLEDARRKGAPEAQLRAEFRLGHIQAGGLGEGGIQEVGELIEAGLPPGDVAAAFVQGYLVRDEPEEARKVLGAWQADRPEDPDVAYMRGVYCQFMRDTRQAQAEFEAALARQPRHELARRALAESLEGQDRLEEAYRQYVEWATRFPTSDAAQAGVARVLRKMGQVEAARAVLRRAVARPETQAGVAMEMAQIELASGNHGEAYRWLEKAHAERPDDRRVWVAAATTLALEEAVTEAERLVARADMASRRQRRLDDLRARLANDPEDRIAAADLARLSEEPFASPPDLLPAEAIGEDRHPDRALPAAELYALHCGACHGDSGDGRGRAARHLFPRARDLRTGKSRLVSTHNAVPTLGDLEAVIRRGMPGTAMRAFENLTDRERRLLAEEVLRLHREGIRQQYVEVLQSEGEEIDEDEVREVVDLVTTPGVPVVVPPIGPADAQSIARGKEAYFDLGCNNCHGEDGTGSWDTGLVDEQGMVAMPRDLVRDPMKGGEEPEAIYLRIFLGMPGTPHPGCWNVPETELVDLVHTIRSLSEEPKRELTNHQRFEQFGRWIHLAVSGEAAAGEAASPAGEAP